MNAFHFMYKQEMGFISLIQVSLSFFPTCIRVRTNVSTENTHHLFNGVNESSMSNTAVLTEGILHCQPACLPAYLAASLA